MHAHLVQFDIAWEDRDANFARVRELLETTDIQAGDLVILPEMFDSGFSLHIERTADTDGRTLAFLADLAREHRAFVQGGRTVLEPDEAHATNRAPVLDPEGTLLCEYAKIHPFSFGREGERFIPGSAINSFTWPPLTCAPAICYDLRFPELFRYQTIAGAEVLTLGANWPRSRQHHWRALAIARAIENQAYMLAVNRTGNDPHLAYAGGSIAVDPRGEVLAELDDEQAVLSVRIDPDRVATWRSAFGALRDIRLLPPEPPLPATPRQK